MNASTMDNNFQPTTDVYPFVTGCILFILAKMNIDWAIFGMAINILLAIFVNAPKLITNFFLLKKWIGKLFSKKQ